jgi:hypothetical protein
MAEACLTLLRDDRLRHRLGAAARTRALENFTVDEAINTFDEIYSFIGRGRPLPVARSRRATEASPATTAASANGAVGGNGASAQPGATQAQEVTR